MTWSILKCSDDNDQKDNMTFDAFVGKRREHLERY